MTEVHSDSLTFFVSPRGVTGGDGSAEKPFARFDEGLQTLRRDWRQQYTVNGEEPAGRTVEIVCIAAPGAAYKTNSKPRLQGYVDHKAEGIDGDGTELAPWADVPTALDHLVTLHEQGKLELKVGQRIRLTLREVFTPTDHEATKKTKENIARIVFMLMAFSLVVPVVAILSYLTFKAMPVLGLEFLFHNPINGMTAGGIWSPLIGTFCLVLVSLAIAAPIGILAGVYLNEYASDNWFTRIVNLAVINLAGVPSIVHGLFGVGAFVLFAGMGRSLIAASCTVAIMTLPVIVTSTKEALASVPKSFREACWNLGATRWQTIRTIVLPNSISGILTGVILQVSRAAGETAPILFTGALFYAAVPESGIGAYLPYGLNDQFMALSYHLFTLATQVPGVEEHIPFATAVVLIGLVLVVNSLSIGFRVYLRSRKKW